MDSQSPASAEYGQLSTGSLLDPMGKWYFGTVNNFHFPWIFWKFDVYYDVSSTILWCLAKGQNNMEQKFVVSIVPDSAYPIWITIQVNKTSIYLNMTRGDAHIFASILSRNSAPNDASFSSKYCLSATVGPTEQRGTYLVEWMSTDYVNIKNTSMGNHNFLVEARWALDLSDRILYHLKTLEPKCTCRCDCKGCERVRNLKKDDCRGLSGLGW